MLLTCLTPQIFGSAKPTASVSEHSRQLAPVAQPQRQQQPAAAAAAVFLRQPRPKMPHTQLIYRSPLSTSQQFPQAQLGPLPARKPDNPRIAVHGISSDPVIRVKAL